MHRTIAPNIAEALRAAGASHDHAAWAEPFGSDWRGAVRQCRAVWLLWSVAHLRSRGILDGAAVSSVASKVLTLAIEAEPPGKVGLSLQSQGDRIHLRILRDAVSSGDTRSFGVALAESRSRYKAISASLASVDAPPGSIRFALLYISVHHMARAAMLAAAEGALSEEHDFGLRFSLSNGLQSAMDAMALTRHSPKDMDDAVACAVGDSIVDGFMRLYGDSAP